MPGPGLIEDENPMQMIWHHDKSISLNVREVLWNLLPASPNALANGIHLHLPIHHLAEFAPMLFRANRHEISLSTTVVEPFHPQPLAFRVVHARLVASSPETSHK
jgi:hypothetical protein